MKIVAGILLLSAWVEAQPPVISHVDRVTAAGGRKVTLTGSNFANAVVFFGAAKGTVQTVTSQWVEVTVPPGATYENISLHDTGTGLMATTPESFLLSYGGNHPFSPSGLSSQTDLAAESGLYDHCLCDLDGDGKTDMASANDNSTLVSLFLNTGTPGSLGFVKSSLTLGVRSLHVRCGDLNGDAKPDLVVSEGGDGTRLFIYQNNGSPGFLSFASQSITLAGRKPKQIEIADLDQDGKAELVVTDQKNGSVIVLRNTSTLASINFDAPQFIPVPNATSTDALAVDDIDNDRLPDIVVSQFLAANSNVFFLKNESTPGNFHLEKVTTLPVEGTLVNIKVGDLDMDGKPDLAATQLLGSGLALFLNQSTDTEIKFSPLTTVETDERPWGLDFADLDGDGKPDMVTASITKKSITVLNNESTPGTLSFQRHIIPTSFINRHVRLGDLDGDGKPDVSFTSIDDNNLGIPASHVSILRNTGCVVPAILPEGPLTICTGFPLRLEATMSAGATYEWKKEGVSQGITTDSFFDPVTSGSYSVTLTAEAGSCSKTAAPVVVTVIAAAAAAVPVFTSNSPVCLGDNLTLSVASAGATDFNWRGPEGFTATGANISRANFQLAHAGRYEVDVLVGTCIAQQSSIIVDAISLPSFRVNFSGSDLVCLGDSKILSVSPPTSGFTYQWFEKTAGILPGETHSTLTINVSGEYSFQAQSTLFPTCPAVESATALLKVVTLPVVDFQAPTTACEEKAVIFTSQSTGDPQAAVLHTWNFGDGASSEEQNPSHTFATSQNFEVKLTVTYPGDVCATSTSKVIQIVGPPAISITTPDPDFDLCEGESLMLALSESFQTYTWNTTATTSTLLVSQPGEYSVLVTTAAGCEATASRTVIALPSPEVMATATPPQISLGQTTDLNATGLLNYQWSPGKSLSDSTSANPVAQPSQTTTYKVKGLGPNGCPGEALVSVEVKQENISDLIRPANFFSPNGDAVNNQWTIENILSFPQCTVSIYDEKGVKVFEATPYLNDWDGTYLGKPLPNGVYYYFVRCEGDLGKPKSGSITLLR